MIGLWSWTDREWTWLRYLEPKKFMIVSERGSYFKQVNVSDRGSRKMWTFPSLQWIQEKTRNFQLEFFYYFSALKN